MLLLRQLDFLFDPARSVPLPSKRGRDETLETRARDILRSLGASAIASEVHVAWSGRLRSTAGRADYRRKLISLNPRLCEHGAPEIERTFLHELAHLLAHFRAGRRRIPPHGAQWRKACCDLGIAGEARCHALPFPVRRRQRPYLYRCPKCSREFPRVQQIRRGLACLACCRRFNHGRYDKRFQLKLVSGSRAA
ncbi:MAG: SprT-like domain-containing protein [Chthoniobacterales bacterium]